MRYIRVVGLIILPITTQKRPLSLTSCHQRSSLSSRCPKAVQKISLIRFNFSTHDSWKIIDASECSVLKLLCYIIYLLWYHPREQCCMAIRKMLWFICEFGPGNTLLSISSSFQQSLSRSLSLINDLALLQSATYKRHIYWTIHLVYGWRYM